MTFSPRPHESIRPPEPPTPPVAQRPALHLPQAEHPVGAPSTLSELAPPDGAGRRAIPRIRHPAVRQIQEASGDSEQINGNPAAQPPTPPEQSSVSPESTDAQPSTPLGALAISAASEPSEDALYPETVEAPAVTPQQKNEVVEVPTPEMSKRYAGANLIDLLPDHPGRVSAEQLDLTLHEPITSVVLVEHTLDNAEVIAKTVEDCDILVIESVLKGADTEAYNRLSSLATDCLSSDPAVSKPAKEAFQKDIPVGDFVMNILRPFLSTDKQIVLHDLPSAGSGTEQMQELLATREKLLEAYNSKPQTPVADMLEILETHEQNVFKSYSPRNTSFAERLDTLRQQHPDKNISLVVGADHFRLASELDDSHRHTLVTPTALDRPDLYSDKYIEALLVNPEQTPPATLIERSVLTKLYLGATHRMGGDRLVQSADLGKDHPDYVHVNNRWTAEHHIQHFLVDSLTDEEVSALLARIDVAKREKENAEYGVIVDMRIAKVFKEFLEEKQILKRYKTE